MARLCIGIDVLLLVLLGYSFAFLEPESASFVIATITLIPIAITLVGGLTVLHFDWDPL